MYTFYGQVKHHIRQQCAGAILRVLEAAATTGWMCRLLNVRGEEITFMLQPKLMSMNFDQPEAQLTFGLSNRTSCSKCRWRKGHSAFRKSSIQRGNAVKRLYVIANDNRAALQKSAARKLKHWGFNPTRRCFLHTQQCNKVLVRLPGQDEVFPCIDYRDKMHALFIFLHRVICTESLNYIYISAANKRIMHQRLHSFQRNYNFRESYSGKSIRKQKNLFSSKDMSAKEKVAMIFLLPHVFGHNAELLSENLRMPMLTALAYAQLLIIAVKGRRSYNVNELKTIFDNGYIMLFGALESLFSSTQAEDEDADAPPAFKRQKRYKTSRTLV